MYIDNAQKLAEYTSEICGHTVLVTDADAVIIGCSDPDRLGQVNEAARLVIRRRAPLDPYPGYIDGMANTKPGITFPIEIGDRVYGAIGIQGVREEVEKYGLLLKRYSELFIRDSFLLQTAQIRENAMNDFLNELVNYDPEEGSAEHLVMRGDDLNFNLNLPRIPLIIDLRFEPPGERPENRPIASDFKNIDRMINTIQFRSIIRTVFSDREDFVAPGRNRRIVILHILPKKFGQADHGREALEKCHELHREFSKHGLKAKIAIGSPATNVQELSISLREARELILISQSQREEDPAILEIRSFIVEHTLRALPRSQREWLIARTLTSLKRQPDWNDISETLLRWGENMFHHGSTSGALGIHRNTLSYRFERIEALSGYNPKTFKDALALYLATYFDKIDSV